jgi:hypothetical protein
VLVDAVECSVCHKVYPATWQAGITTLPQEWIRVACGCGALVTLCAPCAVSWSFAEGELRRN